MNDYEARQKARRERLTARAAAASAEASETLDRARTMGQAIPFGQPILVGHHSEGRDRRYRQRIDDNMRKGFSLMDKADYYKRKAASVGKGGISSDDPDAITKLQSQLDAARRSQEVMKKANALVRKNDRAGLLELGFPEHNADELLAGDWMGRKGFASYALSNNNANIHRIEKRIAELKAAKERASVEHAGNGYTYREDADENRVMFLFDGKPDKATRDLLKSYSFRWSPSREGQPWVRQLTNAGRYAAEMVRKELDK